MTSAEYLVCNGVFRLTRIILLLQPCARATLTPNAHISLKLSFILRLQIGVEAETHVLGGTDFYRL